MMKLIINIATLALSLPFMSVNATEIAPDCASTIKNMEKASNLYSSSMDDFNDENPPDEFKPQACVGGTLRWEKTSFKMDIPEFKMGTKSWSMDIPETKMVNQEWWIKEPYIRCGNKKTGQYPETTCRDTWITIGGFKTKSVPACTTTWSDIITKVCWPETKDKRVVVGVPEIKMVTQNMSMDIPEVTMKTREMSLHLPQFYAEAGCIGPDCAEKCETLMEDHIEDLDDKRAATLKPAKENLIITTSDMFQCQGKSLAWQKENALLEFDKYINVAKTTLTSMTSQGLIGPAAEQEKRLLEMLIQREKIVSQMDSAIAGLEASEREAITKMSQ